MDFIQVVQMVGFPIAAVTVMGLAIWRVGIYLGREVLVPTMKRHIAFIDALEHDLKAERDDTAERLDRIVDRVDRVVDRVDEVAKGIGEVKNLVVRTESVFISSARPDPAGGGSTHAPRPGG
jgi:hypothetical protein